jgi:DnaJ-class molecular chaperone
MACHGTGHVISMLGEERSEVRCPWCAGSGVRQPGIDAQAHWADAGEPRDSR